MPVIILTFISALASAAGTIVGRLLIGLGIGLITYKGIQTLLDGLLGQVKDLLTGLPSEILAISSMMQVDTCISILFSAYTARLILNGLTSDAVKSWRTK